MGASESKLIFKEDVFRLAREDDIPASDPWWQQFYQLPESAEDVFALWSQNDVRNLTKSNPPDQPPSGTQTAPRTNLETLINTCVSRLRALRTRRCYADPHHPIAHEALNCVRILTRVLPYIYEAEHLTEWQRRFFWEPRRGHRAEETKGSDPGESDYGHPLGEQLLDLLVGYMFLPNFTLPRKLDADGMPDLKVQYHIWTSGIGCRQSVGMSRENERNAVELIRLLLSLTSQQLYLQPQMIAEMDVKPITHLAAKGDRQATLSLICSLLNTVLKYNPATWRVPIDFSQEGDAKPKLVHSALQLLLVLLLYPAPEGEINAYRKALSRLHRAEDFQFIQHGLTLVLAQPVSGMSSYLPTAQKTVPWAQEMLVLFWELLQVNKRFRSFIIETDRAHDFVVLVLHYAMEAKNEPSKQGLVRMCVLILQTLSVEASFGSRLNKAFVGQESLPSVLRITNFHGSYADFLIASIHTLMTTTQGRLESVYPALLAIINNIAPYTQNLERATSSKLLALFHSLSGPNHLLEKEQNHTVLMSLLDVFDAILKHQYEANKRFVEVLVRSRKRFRALRDFTVEGATAELDRQAQARKDRNEPAGVRSPMHRGSIDSITSLAASARSPPLGNVPENGAFAIGDDDEDDERHSRASFTAPLSATSSVVDETVPLQSRSMSEKARGKQPIGQGSFSRSTSRNTSNTSLTSLITNNTTPSAPQSFIPTSEWLETWLPHLQLHTILQVLDEHDGTTPFSPVDTTSTVTTIGSPLSSVASARAPEHSGAQLASQNDAPEAKVQAFQWTSLSLGWYLSLLWGFIYASDMTTNRGVNGIWTGTSVKLFNVVASPGGGISLRSPKGAVDAVGNAVVQRLGSLSFTTASSPTTREV